MNILVHLPFIMKNSFNKTRYIPPLYYYYFSLFAVSISKQVSIYKIYSTKKMNKVHSETKSNFYKI